MTQDCIFCKIIQGSIPADKIYEDDDFIVFEALHQTSRGHALIVPKEHSEDLLAMQKELGTKLLALTQKIGTAVMKSLGATGFNVGINTKPDAGQVIFHTHIHIIPRYKDDKLEMWKESSTTDEERALFAQKIIMALD